MLWPFLGSSNVADDDFSEEAVIFTMLINTYSVCGRVGFPTSWLIHNR